MSSITTINGSDVISTSRTTINTNFSNLNTDKIETSTLDTDTTLAANSDSKIATQKATKAYVDASVNPTGRSWNEYAVDSVGSDSYAITVSGISAYVAGQTYKFKAGTANTGACTLNVNGLGAKTIKKDVSSDLVTGDILANQLVVVTYDGTNMQIGSVPIPTPTVQIFTTPGANTWTKPAGMKYAIIEVIGGGGNGGTVSSNPSTGGSGGAGAYSRKLVSTSLLGATETATVGAAATTSTFTVNGGSTITATGGTSASGQTKGVGGTASNGDVNSPGGDGMGGSGSAGTRTTGGASFMGGGGTTGDSAGAGSAGQAYGSGGGGGLSSGSSSAGGAGKQGIIMVTEYY